MDKIVVTGKYTGLTVGQLFELRDKVDREWTRRAEIFKKRIEEIDDAIRYTKDNFMVCCGKQSLKEIFLWDCGEDYEKGYCCRNCGTYFNINMKRVDIHSFVYENGSHFGKCKEI
jgi:hypothetical protein